MISGLNSSGITSAIRTASTARATSEKATRELATGQRVASVKDDGAAWARASALKSERTVWEQAQQWADIRVAISDQRLAMYDQMADVTRSLISTLTAMQQPGLSASSFAALRDDANRWMNAQGALWQQNYRGASAPIYQQMPAPGYEELYATIALPQGNATYFDYSGAPWQFHQGSSVVGGIFTGTGHGGGIVLDMGAWALSLPDQAAAANAAAYFRGALANWSENVATRAAGRNSFEAWSERSGQNIDRLDTAIGSLTDADLGKSSTNLRQAEARQQLALDTVRSAISAYGAFAGGLLGNVARTQRAIA